MSAFFNRINDRRNSLSILGSLFLFPCLTLWTAEVSGESSISRELMKHAPTILNNLRARDCGNIGVLKFQVQMAGGRPSDNVGTFNLLAARRLENALALVEPNPQKPIRLVRDASSVAAGLPGTTHLTADGRGKLFGLDYPAAWGAAGDKLKVDAFVTGLARVDANLRELQLCILGVFPEKEEALRLLAPPISCPLSWDLMPELGKPFRSRGAGGPPREAVQLRVYYDGRPVNPEKQEDDGVFRIPEPTAGQKVALELWRSDNLDHSVGVVLKVNGENTAFNRERVASPSCHKWLLKPKAPRLRIEGYQIDAEQREDFRVAAIDESRELEMNYESDVGMITLELFREVQDIVQNMPNEDNEGAEDAPEVDSPAIAAIEKGYMPLTTPRDHEAYQTQLQFNAKKFVSRGVITGGDVEKHQIEIVSCELEKQPFQSLVLRYYKPRRPVKRPGVAKEDQDD